MANQRIKDAHNNIKPVHPDQTGGVCSTCHSTDDVELLTSRAASARPGRELPVCARNVTSSRRRRGLAAGNGKRLDGWEGRTGGHGPASIVMIPTPRLFRSAFLSARRNSSEPEATTHEC
jgi:hypothetical protein